MRQDLALKVSGIKNIIDSFMSFHVSLLVFCSADFQAIAFIVEGKGTLEGIPQKVVEESALSHEHLRCVQF